MYLIGCQEQSLGRDFTLEWTKKRMNDTNLSAFESSIRKRNLDNTIPDKKYFKIDDR